MYFVARAKSPSKRACSASVSDSVGVFFNRSARNSRARVKAALAAHALLLLQASEVTSGEQQHVNKEMRCDIV
jgi:hypothetical protein